MSHVDEGMLQAWIDGELPEAGVATVQAHVAQCATCDAGLHSLREAGVRVHDALSDIGDTPVADFGTLAEIHRRARRPAFTRFAPVSLTRAAILLIAFASVVAAAVPGSPLRRWIADAIAPEPDAATPPLTEPGPAVPEPAPAPMQETGRAIPLENGRVIIRLVAPAPGVEIRLRLVGGSEAAVTWNAADPDARTRQMLGELDVYGLSDGRVTIEIPRSALDARVEVDGRLWWHKQGSDIRIPGPAHEDTADGVIFSPRS